MSGLSYDVVDVFCDRPFAGNPLAVVHGAHDLSTGQLQSLAREFNLSETTFPSPRDDGAYDVRIFTPALEIPFAGHPTVGTAWLLRRRGELAGPQAVQHCGAGPIDVAVDDAGAELTAPPHHVLDRTDGVLLATGVGLSADDIDGGSRVASCGLGWTFLRVSDAAVGFSAPRAGLDVPQAGADVMGGLCVYSVAPAPGDAASLAVHSRVFSVEHGRVTEDPATGSAAAALGLVLVADGLAAPDGTTGYVIAQGAEAGRPSTLYARVDASAGEATRVHVRGGVSHVASGTIAVPPEP